MSETSPGNTKPHALGAEQLVQCGQLQQVAEQGGGLGAGGGGEQEVGEGALQHGGQHQHTLQAVLLAPALPHQVQAVPQVPRLRCPLGVLNKDVFSVDAFLNQFLEFLMNCRQRGDEV